MSRWLVPRTSLTQDQLASVRHSVAGKYVVLGMPGSGKTLVLVHRAKYLIGEKHVDPEKLHLFVYNRVLRDYIRSALDDLRIPQECVETVDAWCVSKYREHVRSKLPRGSDDRTDYDQVRRAVSRLRLEPVYEHALVDEGQDMTNEQWKILLAIARNHTVCMDFGQRLYGSGLEEREVWERIGVQRREVKLHTLLRSSPYITRLASAMLANQDDARRLVMQCKTTQVERETPLLYYFDNAEDEKRRLVEVVRARQLKGESIGILFPQGRLVYGYAQGLREAGLNVETVATRRGDAGGLDFSSDLPKVLTYHGAKGLTFDSVLMPRLVHWAFGRFGPDDISRMLFVGVSRALKWVFLSTDDDGVLRGNRALMDLHKAGSLTIQRRDRGPDLFTAPQKEAPKPKKDDFGGLL